jgi:hypothetical protein
LREGGGGLAWRMALDAARRRARAAATLTSGCGRRRSGTTSRRYLLPWRGWWARAGVVRGLRAGVLRGLRAEVVRGLQVGAARGLPVRVPARRSGRRRRPRRAARATCRGVYGIMRTARRRRGPPDNGRAGETSAFTDSHRNTTRRCLQKREREGGWELTRRRARSTGESGSRSWGRAEPRARPAAGGRRGGRSPTMATDDSPKALRRCDCASGGVEAMRLCSRRGG